MKVLLQLGLLLVLAFLGFVGGGMIGALFVPAGSGLAGGATVFLWAVGGVIAAVIAGGFAVSRLAPRTQRTLFLVAAALAIVMVAWMAARVASRTVSLLTPALFAAERSQRYPTVERRDLPIGLGIAHVAPLPGGVLRFYGSPGIGETPDAHPPSDVVRFGPGQPSVDIAEAPPWLVPEHLKMDYELFHLRVITLTRDWAEVIGSSRTGETWWVDRTAVRFTAWPEFLLGVNSVVPFDEHAAPVRARPLDDSPILATTTAALPPLAVQGDWLKVSISHLADRIVPEGWIRWRRGDRLLVAYNPLS